MDEMKVSRSGSAFSAADAHACSNPERLAVLTRFLQWTSPLKPISRDDQYALGLGAAHARPAAMGEEAGEQTGED